MLKGLGRQRYRGNGTFVPNMTSPPIRRQTGMNKMRTNAMKEFGYVAPDLPANLHQRAFAKSSISTSRSLYSENPIEVLGLAREIYLEDPVSGSVVDIMSTMPFGEFSLSGVPDPTLLEPYLQSLERLRIKTLLPSLSTTYMVDGAHLSTLVFNESEKIFDGIIPLDLMYATAKSVPFFGVPPLIDMRMNGGDVMQRAGLNDPRMERYLKYLPKEYLSGATIALQPENTLYVARRNRAENPLGVSLFRRIMPLYLLDRALLRGTTEMAHRRQRGILHILMGDENWDPTVEEMRETIDMFMAADIDPLGAVVGTRQGVQPQEVAGAEGMWKWTDVVDVITQVKLKGLGMPDGLLGGDMSLDSVGSTLTVFIQQVRQFREYITRTVLYEKIFAYLAITNSHDKNHFNFEETGVATLPRDRLLDFKPLTASDTDISMGDYIIPVVSWHNSMRPEGDRDYLEMLTNLQEKGVPIPLRMMAAAGGLNIDDILNSQESDLEIRKKIAEYNQTLEQLGGGGEQDDGDFNLESKLADVGYPVRNFRRKGLASREFDDKLDPVNEINGRRYLATSNFKKMANEKANKLTAKAMAERAPLLRKPHRVAVRKVDDAISYF